jgi:DHA2 family multidrug resistance protein
MPRTLAMMLVTPIIGRLYNSIPPALVVAFGIVLFAIGSFELSHITLESGSRDIVIPLIITGFGFACLFIPLTTAALTFIPRADFADAAGLNSFVRQIGGSFGLTIFATLLSKFGTRATASVSWNITNLRSDVMMRLHGMVASMEARGMDPVSAKSMALRAMAGRAAQQGAVLAFEKTFLMQGVVFVLVMPLLFFLRVGEREKSDEPLEIPLE